jgi:hypothetical protein
MSKRKVYFSIVCLFLTTLMIGCIISPVSAQMPFIDVEEDKDTYIPNIYDDYYYYVNPPGTDFTDVIYRGFSGEGEYTTVGMSGFGNPPWDLDRGDDVYYQFLRNTSRTSYNHFFDDKPYPRAVRINSGIYPVFEQSQKEAINLHLDYSSTFLAEADNEYFGFINSSEPFLLDIYIHDENAYGTIDFPAAFPYLYNLNYEKMTYPIFPRGGTSLLNFTLTLNLYSPSSLITLTPHPWEFPNWIPPIEGNTTFIGEFEQGAYDVVDKKTGEEISPENDLFSIRMFNLSLVQDEYYKIYTDYNLREGPTPIAFLVGEHYEHLSGNLNGDGYYIYAEESENATLVIFSPGVARGDYIILFQNKSPIPVPEEYATIPLTLNTNITLDYEVYYTFTFDSPHMMAINNTYYYGWDMYYLEFYVEGTEPGEWISVTDDAFFNPVSGNMYGINQGDIDNANWRYIPAGSYAIEVTWRRSTSGEIRFTTVPVQQPTTLVVDQNSIFAIELPLTRNRLNWVNLSTSDKFYPVQRVEYEWTFVGKYNEQISAATNWEWFGNENSSINGNAGIWDPWDYNDTIINALLPTRDYEVPILMIRPFRAENQTLEYPDAFTATLTVSVNEALNQSLYDLDWLGVSPFVSTIPSSYLYQASGPDWNQYFIPLSAISGTTSFDVNDAYTTDDDHLYGIPLTLDPYSIYNITVYLIGNSSTGPGNWNATFEDSQIFVHGGNLQDLEIFNTHTEAFDNTSVWRSLLILTVSSTSYLYVDLERQLGNNATIQIVITKLSLTNMNFDLPDHEYNDTVSDLEVLTEDLLATQIMPPEMEEPRRAPGFGLAFTVGTLVILATGISLKRRKK